VAVTTRLFLVVVAWLLLAAAAPAELLRGLDTDDPTTLRDAVAAIERAPAGTPELADVLFAAARACEDRLYDPARALALYDRILRELPDARVAVAANRRVEMLRDVRGRERDAAELVELRALIDLLPAEEIERRVARLSARDSDALLVLAEWQCRGARYRDAQRTFARVPGAGARGATACAIEAEDWPLARTLAARVTGPERDELLDAIGLGERRALLYRVSWVALVLGALLLLGSLAEATALGGVRLPSWRPPVGVVFLAPVGAIVIAAAYAIDSLVRPAVVALSVAGAATAWLSGITLDLLRLRGRPLRARAVVHVLLCAAIVISAGYIVMTRADLLDMLGETVRFGPGA